jgi:hypothetical protein
MAATMTMMPRSGNNATPLGDNATPLGACSETTTPRLGDDANLGDNAMPLGARSVTTTPRSETLGNNTKLGNDSTLGNDATLANDATHLGDNTKLIAQTLQCHAWATTPCSVTKTPSSATMLPRRC